jgi:hypothetical protein
VRILIDSNSIPRIERNSLSLRQLVQPGCQNAFSGAVSGIAYLSLAVTMLAPPAAGVNRRDGIGAMRPSRRGLRPLLRMRVFLDAISKPTSS